MSASEELRSPTPNIDLNLCLHDNSSPSPSNGQMHFDDDPNSMYHVVFVRDVAPYQRSQYQLNGCYQDARDACFTKKKYTIRIQGVKTERDKKHASILPEIKVSFVWKNIYISKMQIGYYLCLLFLSVSITLFATRSSYTRCCYRY